MAVCDVVRVTVLMVFGVDLICRIVVVRVVDLVRVVDFAMSARGGAGRLLVLMVGATLIMA